MPTAVRERRTRSRRIRRGYSRRLLGDQVCEPRRLAGRGRAGRRRSRSSSCTSPTSRASRSASARRRSTPTSRTSPCSRSSLAALVEGVRRRLRTARGPAGRSGSRGALFLVVDVRRGRARPPPRRRVRLAHARRHRREVRGVRAARTVRAAAPAPRRATCCSAPGRSFSGASFATVVGIAQFFGADIFLAGTVGRRQASFLASADFAALSAAALLVGIVGARAAARAPGRALIATALATGVLGMIVAGALASVLGLATALVVLAVVLVLRREARRCAASPASRPPRSIVLGGAIAIRGSDLDAFARFLGASHRRSSSAADEGADVRAPHAPHVDRLADLEGQSGHGRRLGGVGGAGELRAVHARPRTATSRTRRRSRSRRPRPTGGTACRTRGCRRSRISASIGFVLWVGSLRERRVARARATLAAPGSTRCSATLLLAWLWTAQGYVAGIPLDALTWLTFGLAATRLRTE